MDENPFDDLEIDPRLSGRELTRRIRKIIDRAPSTERATIQAHWQRLTLHDDDRVRFALLAHPRPDSANSSALETLRDAVPPPASKLVRRHIKLSRADVVCWNTAPVELTQFRPPVEIKHG